MIKPLATLLPDIRLGLQKVCGLGGGSYELISLFHREHYDTRI